MSLQSNWLFRNIKSMLLNVSVMEVTLHMLPVSLSVCTCHNGKALSQVSDRETAFRYGVQLRIYRVSSSGQPTWGGPPVWGLGAVLISSHSKN